MPFITAALIHNGASFLPAGSALEITEEGQIKSIVSTAPEGTVHYDGILSPGFVNAHCHLELSHMKGVIPEQTGLIPFLQQVTFHRNDFDDEQRKTARHEAFRALIANGVVATGDIANGTDTLDLRASDQLHLHTFVECIGFTNTHAAQRLEYSEKVRQQFAAQQRQEKILAQSVVPHAPYSVSESLFRLISEHDPSALLSIHNQETAAEDDFYRSNTGAVHTLLEGFGIDASFFQPSGRSSVQSYGEWLSVEHPVLLVHNTFSSQDDIDYVHRRFRKAYWCLCPNANLYIENRLPDVPLLEKSGALICVGTDSLASNHQLSVLTELQTLREHFPGISWETLLAWGTGNGALALQMQDRVGFLEPGLRPGILQLTGMDTAPMVRRLY